MVYQHWKCWHAKIHKTSNHFKILGRPVSLVCLVLEKFSFSILSDSKTDPVIRLCCCSWLWWWWTMWGSVESSVQFLWNNINLFARDKPEEASERWALGSKAQTAKFYPWWSQPRLHCFPLRDLRPQYRSQIHLRDSISLRSSPPWSRLRVNNVSTTPFRPPDQPRAVLCSWADKGKQQHASAATQRRKQGSEQGETQPQTCFWHG